MKKNILIAVCLVFLATPCWADSLEDIRKAAEQGNSEAQFHLGEMYAKGRGVLHDDTEAVKWFRQAAEQGNAEAQYNLGVMYHEGRGVSRNDTEAVKWVRQAAEQGHSNSHFGDFTLFLMAGEPARSFAT